MPTIAAPVTEKIEPCDILCPACGQTHTVVRADWFDERGRKVSEREAVLCAHYRAEITERSKRPFQLFRTTAPVAPAAPVRAVADVKHEPTPGYFAADWDAFKKRPRSRKVAR